MNLPVFLNQVDTLASKLSRKDLEGFVHEMARTLPEGRRDYFLDILKSFNGPGAPQKMVRDEGYSILLADIEAIKKKLSEINDGERCLDSEYNVEWDEWYNSDADEVLFMDPEGVLDDINEAMELIHRCVDMEAYKEGCILAGALAGLEVLADGDYNDFDGAPLSMHELSEHRLLSNDFKKMVKECLYLTYIGNTLEDRADEMFCMMENFGCSDISLENILQSGYEELPEFDEFLLQWIACLGKQKSRHTERLLHEAQAMLQDEDIQIENARKYAADHPSLYKQIFDMKLASGENEKMLQIGMEALEKIPCSYVVRSEVALLTAEYACKLQDGTAAENCWLEAFRSHSTVVNYMRIRLRTKNWAKYADTVKMIYEQIYKETEEKRKHNNNIYVPDLYQKNSLHKQEYCFLLFLEEQFDRVLQLGMNEKYALGWSATFMKQGLALFLLLLYEGEDLTAGLKTMLNMVIFACGFKANEYFQGTGGYDETDDSAVFWELFCQWKRSVEISDNQREEWLGKIDKWINFRVEGIMDGNHRNYYGECAAYIAAFGEVQESLGILGAKSDIMERYKSAYSRRRAFHQELRGYGMKR